MLSVEAKEFLVTAVVATCWIGGIFVSWAVPRLLKSAHVRRQNDLMTQCRAFYVAAIEAIHENAEAEARELLRRIRNREGKWKIGYSIAYRFALACWAILLALMACAASRLVMVGAMSLIEGRPLSVKALDLSLLATVMIVSLSAVFHGLISWLDAWTQPWIIDNCGDRLEAYIGSPRTLTMPEDQEPAPKLRHGLTDLELFGLSPIFTLRELNRARRVLAGEYHPDRWLRANPSARRAAEESMKQVNVAYDRLKSRTGA